MVENQSTQPQPIQSCPTQLQQSQPIESYLLQPNDQGNCFHKTDQLQHIKILARLQGSLKCKIQKGMNIIYFHKPLNQVRILICVH